MRFQIYKSLRTRSEIKVPEWRWRLLAKNGKIIADSSEGYKRRSHAIKMVHKILLAADSAQIVFK